jgi:type IV pilus assembly protein PilY1
MKAKFYAAAWAVALTGLVPCAAWAQVTVTDDFTQGAASVNWVPFNGACLTAGNGSGTIPACSGLPYYTEPLTGGATGTLPDPVGQGALRFTNGYPGGYHQNGAIILNPANSFPTNSGVQVTFTTVTYRGDSGGTGTDGADGISFFLLDASQAPNIGSWGGSLGYTCSNSNAPYTGMVGAYIGLGIDEFGNFLNGTNLMPGYTGANIATGDNTAFGYGYKPDRIGLRGAGNVSWAYLSATYPSYYPVSILSSPAQQQAAVQLTCSTGVVWNYSGGASNPTAVTNPSPPLMDYAPIPNAYKELTGLQIANEFATGGLLRSNATPIAYKLKITTDGLLSLSYSINSGAFQPVITGQNITTANGPLPTNFLFGFGGSTGGDTNIHEIMCFRATPVNQSSSSAGTNQQQTSKIQAGSQVYFAYYNPDTWAGSVTAQYLLEDVNGNITGYSTPTWDASCVLTGLAEGATCPTTLAASAPAEAPTNRTILSWNGSKGIAFEWASLTTGSTGQQTALDKGDPTPYNANRLNFLRGDRSNEQTSSGTGLYRDRTSVLGDIVDSSPTWVGPASSPYTSTFVDKIGTSPSFPENSGQSYATFKSSGAQTRLNVVYVGANDGLLHGFRSGAYNSSNVYNPALNDGYEVMAYMPGAIVNDIHNATNSSLDFSSPQYGHNFYVDASPGTGDLYYQGAWHTWLVGGLGAGGNAIYAIDVTKPANFSESNAANLVIGEWSSATLTCANVSGCGANLGNTYGVPQIRRFHNGKWGAVFGNGLGAANGAAGIFVMIVDPTSATETFYYIGTSGTAAGNGIAYVTAADLDADNITDYVYAGDALGNLWRFDLTAANPNSWTASATPLFTTPGNQPITTQIIVASVPANTGPPRVMIDFGTGQLNQFTNSSAATYASGSQALYGIWDWNMGGTNGWDTKGSVQYASLSAPQSISSANLQAQTISSPAANERSVTANPVCWQGSTACPSANNQFGWQVVLPGTNEQVVYSPILELGIFIVNTTIPAVNSPLNCASTLPSGFTMAINPTTGGSFPASVFADSTGSFNNLNISGMEWSGTGSGEVVTSGGTGTVGSKVYYVTQTVSGAIGSNGNGVGTQTPFVPQQMNVSGGTQGARLTWVQRR